MNITNDIRYIGVNDHEIDLFEGQFDVPNGMAYNSYVILDEKVAVLELKNAMKTETIQKIVRVIEEMEYLDKTIFISFALSNLITLRQAYPQVSIQYLVEEIGDLTALLEILKKYRFDIDAKHTAIKEEMIPQFHENGIKVNVWTVNTAERAERLQQIGVDYITTNIVE